MFFYFWRLWLGWIPGGRPHTAVYSPRVSPPALDSSSVKHPQLLLLYCSSSWLGLHERLLLLSHHHHHHHQHADLDLGSAALGAAAAAAGRRPMLSSLPLEAQKQAPAAASCPFSVLTRHAALVSHTLPCPVVSRLVLSSEKSWAGFEAYVIARLPQLERLDGKEITRTARIKAQQRLPALREEIVPLAEEVRVIRSPVVAPTYILVRTFLYAFFFSLRFLPPFLCWTRLSSRFVGAALRSVSRSRAYFALNEIQHIIIIIVRHFSVSCLCLFVHHLSSILSPLALDPACAQKPGTKSCVQ